MEFHFKILTLTYNLTNDSIFHNFVGTQFPTELCIQAVCFSSEDTKFIQTSGLPPSPFAITLAFLSTGPALCASPSISWRALVLLDSSECGRCRSFRIGCLDYHEKIESGIVDFHVVS